MIALILGGGAGTRLFPLTYHRSKPAVPLAGKYRLIDIPVSNCINSDVNRIFVLTQFNSASLNRHLSQTYRFDQFRQGFVNILAAEQTPKSKEWFQGTADAVRQSIHHLSSYKHEHVLILSGDQLYTMDYRTLVEDHKEADADITIATIPVHANDAPGFGILKTDDDGVITRFHEKPPADQLDGLESRVSDSMQESGRVYLASMGIYIFSKGVLGKLLDANRNYHDFGKEIIPSAIDTHRVTSYSFTGYWSDIGTIRSFFDANLMLARPRPDFDMYHPRMPLYTNARMLPPAKVRDADIRESIIAEASVIGSSSISRSVIGLRSFVGNNVSMKETVMMGADYYKWHDAKQRSHGPDEPGIGDNTVIEGAIIDRNVSIGANCVIGNRENVTEKDGDGYYIRDGIVVIPKNKSIPDNTRI